MSRCHSTHAQDQCAKLTIGIVSPFAKLPLKGGLVYGWECDVDLVEVQLHQVIKEVGFRILVYGGWAIDKVFFPLIMVVNAQ